MTVGSSIGSAPSPAYNGPDAVGLAKPTTGDDRGNLKAFDDPDGPSFSDLLDVINPLQHIPIINTLYQHLTGDKEGAVADVLGGALWGGLIGLGAAVANLIIEDNTGKSVGDHVYALFSDDDADTAIATNESATDQTASAAGGAIDDSSTVAPMDPGKLFDLNASKQTANPGDTAMAGGGPILAGNFMIFGAGSAAAASPTVSQQTNSKTPTPAIAEGGSAPSQSGDFLVFGGGQSTGGSQIVPPSGTATSGPQALTPVTETGDMTAAAGQAAGQAAQPNSNYVASLRRNTVTPRQTLPLPTTGPAAIPGNMRTASTARSGTDQTDSTWFVGAFNQAMDKYNRAAGLGDTKSAPPQDANDRETANSVLRMN